MARTVLLFWLLTTIFGCTSEGGETVELEKEFTEPLVAWSVPQNEVLSSYTPFPLVTNSSFVAIDKVGYPDNHPTVLISLAPDELRAYPNAYYGVYEVINNEYGDKKFAITHCPQTASTICWDRVVGEAVLTIKASGYLFRENLMPTDIETGTIWSQMLMRGVHGTHDFVFHNTYNIVETDWKTVKDYFPQAKVYSEVVNNAVIPPAVETGPTNRDFYRYGILAGVKDTNVHLFNYDLFEGEGLKLISAAIAGKKILVVGNKDLNFISSYFVDGTKIFSVDATNPMYFKDDNGNIYNAMGLVLDGPDKDLQLTSPKAYTAAWAAWQDFFENFVIYE